MRVPLNAATLPLLALILAASACGDEAADTGAEDTLPPEEETEFVIDSGFVVDTGDTGFNVGDQDREPEHTLTMSHEGEWSLTPLGGPYTALTGHMDVVEVLDGDLKEPACELTWSLTGELVDEETGGACASCAFTFAVQFYLSEGEAGACSDPELPADGDTWLLGFDEADGVLTREYDGTGIWIPWFAAELDGDTLSFDWSASVGVLVEEEE